MNSVSIILASIALSSVGAVVVSFALRPVADTSPVDAASVADLQRAVAELRTANTELQGKLAAMAVAPAPAAMLTGERVAVPAVTNEQVAAAVEAYLKRQGSGDAAVAAAGDGKPTFDLDSEFAKLLGVSFDEDPELWKRLHAAGKGKEAIARLEEMVKANPKDTKAQMELANACLSYMRVVPSDYQLAIRADRAFDDVLALDDKHWEARFTKAVSYSFWPPLTGKPQQAIGHLEQLVAQQESMPAQAHEAHTYIILGNLLEERDSAKAKEIWKKGARRHPDNEELVKKAGR